MANALHFELPQEQLHPAMGSLVQSLNNEGRQDYRLDVANRLWGQQSHPFLDAYLDPLEQQYGAGLECWDAIDRVW